MREGSPNPFSPGNRPVILSKAKDLCTRWQRHRSRRGSELKSLFQNILVVSPCGSRFYPESGRYPLPKLLRINTLAERTKTISGGGERSGKARDKRDASKFHAQDSFQGAWPVITRSRGREFDLAAFQVHRTAEIDDALVVRIGHWKREVDASCDALVRPGLPLRTSARDAISTRTTRTGSGRAVRIRIRKNDGTRTRSCMRGRTARLPHISLPGRCTIPRTRRVQRIESRSVIRGG